jgi:DhnA family fructose-bisphosphate aldolase class Ia
LTVKANQRTLNRQIQRQFEGKRQIPFLAVDQGIGHGRDITWTLRDIAVPETIREAWLGTG